VLGTALTQEALVRQLRAALSQFDVDISQYSGHKFPYWGGDYSSSRRFRGLHYKDSRPLEERGLPIVCKATL